MPTALSGGPGGTQPPGLIVSSSRDPKSLKEPLETGFKVWLQAPGSVPKLEYEHHI